MKEKYLLREAKSMDIDRNVFQMEEEEEYG